MTVKLKAISREAIPRAIQKAERYRLLNQSWAAESICLDILEIDPGNQHVIAMLVLALTDMHGGVQAARLKRAREYIKQLTDPYQRTYYTGMVAERRGQALLQQGAIGSTAMAYDSLREAMSWYQKAEDISPPGNDDAILRWNTCARVLAAAEALEVSDAREYEPELEE